MLFGSSPRSRREFHLRRPRRSDGEEENRFDFRRSRRKQPFRLIQLLWLLVLLIVVIVLIRYMGSLSP